LYVSDVLNIEPPVSDLKYAMAAQETAIRVAIAENAKDLSVDEQFLVATTLKKLARAGETSAAKFVPSPTIRITVAAFAKFASVDAVTAKRRLVAASAALFRRSCVAVYLNPEGTGEVKGKFRWIDGQAVGDSFIKIYWTAIFMEEIMSVLDIAKVERSKTPTMLCYKAE
jgi:hypothetical protein